MYICITKQNTMQTKKITLATLKSFVKKNEDHLHINVRSRFNGMTDCVESKGNQFKRANILENVNKEHNLGIEGAWLVLSSRDYLRHYDDGNYVGIDVSNCCGHFIIAVPK